MSELRVRETSYDDAGDVVMLDIEDEITVQAITLDLSKNRRTTSKPRRNQPFDVRFRSAGTTRPQDPS